MRAVHARYARRGSITVAIIVFEHIDSKIGLKQFHAISEGYDFCDWNFGGNDPTKFWMIKGGLNLSRY